MASASGLGAIFVCGRNSRFLLLASRVVGMTRSRELVGRNHGTESRRATLSADSRGRLSPHQTLVCDYVRDRVALPGAIHANVASGSSLFPAATQQESGIHADCGDLAGARHWRDNGGIQRDLCRVDESLPLSGRGPDRAADGADESGTGRSGESQRSRRFSSCGSFASSRACWRWISTP